MSTDDLSAFGSITALAPGRRSGAGPAHRAAAGRPEGAPRPGASTTCGYHIRMMVSPLRRTPLVLAVLVLLAAACSSKRPPITLQEGVVVVQNQTAREWRNVVVTVNDHFRGGVASLGAGGRMTAPLSEFQTAFNQRFDRGRQTVFKIEVTATDADGTPVALNWTGNGQPRPAPNAP
jgi:hypothetical protein